MLAWRQRAPGTARLAAFQESYYSYTSLYTALRGINAGMIAPRAIHS
jgi:hypothetical protein